MQSLFILGRQPALGMAELESLYGASPVSKAGTQSALLDVEPAAVDFERLGGSTKFGRVLGVLDTIDWKEIEKYLIKIVPEHAKDLQEGKLTIGISAYGLRVSPAAVQATGLSLKKAIRKSSGRSVRLVPNKELELNTAQVLHNHLTDENGWELLIVRDDRRTIVAQTVQVQDIESYTVRDRERPKRDTRVGMLPPKLAQIIINLATGLTAPQKGDILLDPFCGTGVVLQEASLMGFDIYGTDLEPRMIEYTDTNLLWLLSLKDNRVAPSSDNRYYTLEVGDATTHHWKVAPQFVACETYLGRPFTSLPAPDVLKQTISECNTIISKFLRNIGSQIPPGARLCLALPAWQVRPNQFRHLPLIDQISDMGYNHIRLMHVRSEDLLYYRAHQVVARELLVIEKN